MRTRRRFLEMGISGLAAACAPESTPVSDSSTDAPDGAGYFTAPVPEARVPLDLALLSDSGRTTLAEVLNGRPALISLWASWCAPCIAEKPSLDRLAGRLKDSRAAIQVLSIRAFDGTPSLAAAHEMHRRFNLVHLRPYVDLSDPPQNSAFVAYLGTAGAGPFPALPTTLLIDREGRDLGRRRMSAIMLETPDDFAPTGPITFEEMQRQFPSSSIWDKSETFEYLRSISA